VSKEEEPKKLDDGSEGAKSTKLVVLYMGVGSEGQKGAVAPLDFNR